MSKIQWYEKRANPDGSVDVLGWYKVPTGVLKGQMCKKYIETFATEEEAEANFSLTSRTSLLRGGDSELPAIIPGVGADSPLVRFAAGIEPEMKMPPVDARDEYPALSDEEVSLLHAWVDQGAKW